MERVYISDRTLTQTGKKMPLGFRDKIELSRLIDRLEVDSLELPEIENRKVDPLLIKSISAAVNHAEIAVPVGLGTEKTELTWNALKEAKKARLQVFAPVSSVQMEYLYHMKPEKMKAAVVETIRACREFTENVEFIAGDAFRGDESFLVPLVQAAIEAGATRVTFQEAAGSMLPEEARRTLTALIESIGSTDGVILGVDFSDELSLADACAVEGIHCGIREIKACAYPINCADLSSVVNILALKGEKMGVCCQTRREEIRRVTTLIGNLCRATQNAADSAISFSESDDEIALNIHDSRESVCKAMDRLGYLLSSEDQEKVYQAFLKVAEKKDRISLKELDALIATEAMQVPPAYQITRYMISSENEIGATARMLLTFHDQNLEGVSAGDGVIDAAFLALEQAVGRHFELDDFQIQAVTEGREAMGETIVRLRSDGKLYSGRGISTDIVGASVMAYVNALNKIVYEEEVE